MRKILVVGEHPANESGFGNLTHYISTILSDSTGIDEVTTMGILPRISDLGIQDTNYILIDSNKYIPPDKDAQTRNAYGKVSVGVFLARTPGYTDVLMIGDPWSFETILQLKPMFPKVLFHCYCPCESEKMAPEVWNDLSSINKSCKIKDILMMFDTIIAYSKTGLCAINNMLGVPKCTHYKYHAVDGPPSEIHPVPEIDQVLEGKFVVGIIGRNGYRKSTDQLLFLAQKLIGTNIIILAHVPKHDLGGYSVDNLLAQLDPHTRDHIVFMEDLKRDTYESRVGNMFVRDVKNGLTRQQLEYLYSKMHLFINMSRAEGFGFPIAEAMLRGIPTLVNGYATPKEVQLEADCPEAVIEITGREFFPAGNDMEMGMPNVHEFASAIIDLEESESFRTCLAEKQKDFATKRLLLGCGSDLDTLYQPILGHPVKEKGTNIIHISSPMRKCGIRTYTENLAEHLPISIIGTKDLNDYIDIIKASTGMIFHIQYEASLWDEQQMMKLISACKSNGNRLIMTVHTYNPAVIKMADGPCELIHFHSDVDALKNQIIHSKVLVHPHPFPIYGLDPDKRTKMRQERGFKKRDIVIGINGFALPYKKIAEQSAAVLRVIKEKGLSNIKLYMVCSPHESDQNGLGERIVKSVVEHAKSIGIPDSCVVDYGYFDKHEMAEMLHCMDVALFYHNAMSVGSQSGSIRELLAAGVLPFVTTLKNGNMHQDLLDNKCAVGLGFKERAMSPQEFAITSMNIIEKMASGEESQSIPKLIDAAQFIKKYTESHTFAEFAKVLNSLYNTK